MSHFDLVRMHRTAILNRHRARSLAPGFGERALAFGIDLGGFVLAAPFLLGICAVLLRDLWVIGAVLIVAGYLAGSWALGGQTIGMSVVRTRLLDERTGRGPSIAQALVRTALTVPPLVGATVVLNEILAPGATALPQLWVVLAVAATMMGAISVTWSLVDPGRMLHDRLAGVVTVRDEFADEVRRAARR